MQTFQLLNDGKRVITYLERTPSRDVYLVTYGYHGAICSMFETAHHETIDGHTFSHVYPMQSKHVACVAKRCTKKAILNQHVANIEQARALLISRSK